MKKNAGAKAAYYYLTRCLLTGFGAGACVGMIFSVLLEKSWGFGLGIGAGLGMLLGIVIGTVLDDRNKSKG